MGPLSKATDREVELLMQFLEVPTHQVAHLHVLEVMNACHESQRTGRRVSIETSFKWPLFG